MSGEGRAHAGGARELGQGGSSSPPAFLLAQTLLACSWHGVLSTSVCIFHPSRRQADVGSLAACGRSPVSPFPAGMERFLQRGRISLEMGEETKGWWGVNAFKRDHGGQSLLIPTELNQPLVLQTLTWLLSGDP